MLLKKFFGLSKVLRIVLLVIPFCNWVCEIVLRWSNLLEKKDAASLLVALLATFGFGVILGFVDIVNDKLYIFDLILILFYYNR